MTAYLCINGSAIIFSSKVKRIGAIEKPSLTRASSCKVENQKPGDLSMSRLKVEVTSTGGPNPPNVEKLGMTCGSGVKGQSNSEIAGSPESYLGSASGREYHR